MAVLKLTMEEKTLALFLDTTRTKTRTPVQVIDILTQGVTAWGAAEVKGGKDPKGIQKIVASVKDDISEQVFKARDKARDRKLIAKQARNS